MNTRTDWRPSAGIGRTGALVMLVSGAQRSWDSIYASPDSGKVHGDLGDERHLEAAIRGGMKLGAANQAHRGELLCECWCHRTLVWVPADDIGRSTGTCGRPGCEEVT